MLSPCESDRQPMKCCSSIMPCVHPTINEANQQLACIPTNFNKFMTNETGVLSIVSCSDGSDDDEAAQCIQDYQSDSVDVYDIIPVSEVNTGAVYRNIHCALYNGVKVDYVKYWLLNVVCEDTSNIDVREDVDILAAVRQQTRCDLKFINPDPDVTYRQCNHAIDTCNVTGLSFLYIREDESGCIDSRIIQYTHYNNMVLKNGLCASCNGMTFGNNAEVPEIPSFSVLMSFKTKPGTDDQTLSVCSPGNLFHKPAGRCVEARCSSLRRLRNNVCERTIHTLEAFSYRIGLRLTTDYVLNIHTALNIAKLLQEPLNKLLQSVFGSIEKIVLNIFLIVDLEYNQYLDVSDISQANLLWYDLQLKLKNVESQDPEEKLEKLLRLSRQEKIGLYVTDGMVINVKVKSMDDYMYFPYGLLFPDNNWCSYDLMEFGLGLDFDAAQPQFWLLVKVILQQFDMSAILTAGLE